MIQAVLDTKNEVIESQNNDCVEITYDVVKVKVFNLLSEVNYITHIDLATSLTSFFVMNNFRFENWGQIAVFIQQMVENKDLKELEYVVDKTSYRVKSLYFLGSTKLRIMTVDEQGLNPNWQ